MHGCKDYKTCAHFQLHNVEWTFKLYFDLRLYILMSLIGLKDLKSGWSEIIYRIRNKGTFASITPIWSYTYDILCLYWYWMLVFVVFQVLNKIPTMMIIVALPGSSLPRTPIFFFKLMTCNIYGIRLNCLYNPRFMNFRWIFWQPRSTKDTYQLELFPFRVSRICILITEVK